MDTHAAAKRADKLQRQEGANYRDDADMQTCRHAHSDMKTPGSQEFETTQTCAIKVEFTYTAGKRLSAARFMGGAT